VLCLGVQLWWTDTRLRWTPGDYKGVDMLWFVCDPHDKAREGHNRKQRQLTVDPGNGVLLQGSSEIWSPDVTLWNAAHDTDATLVSPEQLLRHRKHRLTCLIDVLVR